jgi:hypothetical protein
VDQDRVALGHREHRAKEHLRGHALEHHPGRLLGLDALGELDQPVGVDQPLLGIAADRSGISDPVARLHIGDVRSDRFDQAGALHARGERQLLRVEPGAVIDVDEVEPGGFLLEPDLARAGLTDLDILPLEDLRPSGIMDSDRARH